MASVYKGTDAFVAHMEEVRGAVVDVAVPIRDEARRRLAAHHKTGEHEVNLRLGARTDAFIDLEGPAAAALERGHIARDGTTYVPGLNILGGAAGL